MQIIVCIGEAVALMTSNIAIIFTNLTLKEAFETDAQLNEGVR